MKLTLAEMFLLAGSLLPAGLEMLSIQPPDAHEPAVQQDSLSEKSNSRDGAVVEAGKAPNNMALFEVTVDGKDGFIDKHGKIVIEPKFDKAYPFTDGLAAVRVGEQWGFIDDTGNYVIEPKFAQVRMFSNGLAAVRLSAYTDPWGYIDKNGKLVIEPQYDCAEDFRNGIAKVGMETSKSRILGRIADVGTECNYHYIDLQGNQVPEPCPEHYATGKPGELISFRKDRLVGFVDGSGKVVIEPQFLAVHEFSDGLACVCKNQLFGYIDRTGEFVITPSFQYANGFSDGLAGVQIEEGKWGFIDKTGKVVIPATYDWIYGGFREGLAQVTVAGRLGYINKKGEWMW